MPGNDSNIAVLFFTALIIAFGVTALNLSDSSAPQEASLERVLISHGYVALDPRTFLKVSALSRQIDGLIDVPESRARW
jgi:hypothetical protein